jgi:adenylate kinase
MNIEILGPRGVGKTTLAKQLANNYNIEYVSLGQISRHEITQNTPVGISMKKYIDSNLPYPEGFLISLISEKIQKANQNGGFILDGYPRQISEAFELKQILKNINTSLNIVAVLETNLDDILQRVCGGRLICTTCDYQSEPINRIKDCPHCNCALIKRTDDTPEEIQNAYDLYLAYGETITNILTADSAARLFKIDGGQTPNFIATSLIYNINKLC